VWQGSGSAGVAAIDAGELVVLPSVRWYMMCDRADGRMFQAKRRPPDRHLMLGIADAGQARRTFVVNPAAEVLMAQFWPGDLALPLPWLDVTARSCRYQPKLRCAEVGQ
jgi:L-threonylcarbamoyladenylate synthase